MKIYIQTKSGERLVFDEKEDCIFIVEDTREELNSHANYILSLPYSNRIPKIYGVGPVGFPEAEFALIMSEVERSHKNVLEFKDINEFCSSGPTKKKKKKDKKKKKKSTSGKSNQLPEEDTVKNIRGGQGSM
jgi:hypothetical protein